MPRRYRSRKKQDDSAVISLFTLGFLGLGVGVWQHESTLFLIFGGMAVFAVLIIIYIVLNERHKRDMLVKSGIHEIDQMSGIDFEKYLQVLLTKRGFRNVKLTTTYDLGIDLIAEKDGHRWGIQAKRYKANVGLDSVRQVVAAANHYNCDKTIVITNGYFTRNARMIAQSTDCKLMDRDGLISFILMRGLQSKFGNLDA